MVDAFTKYASVRPLNDKKAKTILHSFFFEIANESKRKPNRLWADQKKMF